MDDQVTGFTSYCRDESVPLKLSPGYLYDKYLMSNVLGGLADWLRI